jgi:glycosyltransferase involved in cell wall biosynthesis
LRDALGLAHDRPIVLYHGQFKPGRGIEEQLRAAAVATLRQLTPAIILLGYGRLRPLLEEAARQDPDGIYVLPAVPPDELLDWVAGADVAYVGFPPLTLNMRLTIPNKLFESIMAGVPVVSAGRWTSAPSTRWPEPWPSCSQCRPRSDRRCAGAVEPWR